MEGWLSSGLVHGSWVGQQRQQLVHSMLSQAVGLSPPRWPLTGNLNPPVTIALDSYQLTGESWVQAGARPRCRLPSRPWSWHLRLSIYCLFHSLPKIHNYLECRTLIAHFADKSSRHRKHFADNYLQRWALILSLSLNFNFIFYSVSNFAVK